MQIRFLLGPSGSGKTFRCLDEVRKALLRSPAGPPLLFLAPRQATFQLERQLLTDGELAGYTRLQIVSFDRLAELVLEEFQQSPPRLLSEEGRIMVLRALLSQKRDQLELFRATARLRGVAEQLSVVLRDFQRFGVTPQQLLERAASGLRHKLDLKLRDLAALLQAYMDWLKEHDLHDQDQLLEAATVTLRAFPPGDSGPASPRLRFEGLWLDGFAEMSPQEIDFLAALLPNCDQAVLAFNIDRPALGPVSWLSAWSLVSLTYRKLRERVSSLPGCETVVEWLDRDSGRTRFSGNPVLRHLERHWASPKPFPGCGAEEGDAALRESVRVVACAHPEAEVTFAAREIVKFVRAGGRFREVAVVARTLDPYADPVRRIFTAFDIPFFLDRREPVDHHPLSELTRCALRTIAYYWQPADWFGALKTGLVHPDEMEIDRLENEALARGWKGKDWHEPFRLASEPELAAWAEPLRKKLMRPFEKLNRALTSAPGIVARRSTGIQMAEALRAFWRDLRVEEQLAEWSTQSRNPLHTTFWEQMLDWLENLSLAFGTEALSLREWLPVIEAGLSSQTVGVIPPALDQVLVGALDRSRNPDLRMAIVLGMNETIFPAAPSGPSLLSDADRDQLAESGFPCGLTRRDRLSQENYLGYIACTRARERLILTYSIRDAYETPLNPSLFIAHLERLFPGIKRESFGSAQPWIEAEHPCEVVGPLLQLAARDEGLPEPCAELVSLPAFEGLRSRLEGVCGRERPVLDPVLAERLYGPALQSSVSRLEDFAACPFKFFITSGLKAEERKKFELDVKEQGSLRHEILARFHHRLKEQGRRWRDLTPQEARGLIRSIADEMLAGYRDGLLEATGQTRFTARSIVVSLEDLVAQIVEWMPQYGFDPEAVEIGFGLEEEPLPAWTVELEGGRRLSFRGKIDRVDLCPIPGRDEALCVVIDYKSSGKRLDPVLCQHGVQLQLTAYLNVLQDLKDPKRYFGVSRLIPAGVFYVNLRGRYENGSNRKEVLSKRDEARRKAYQHVGRFDLEKLRALDRREDCSKGDQFNYRLKNDGQPYKNCADILPTRKFVELLKGVERHLKEMGNAIFRGCVEIDPYAKGQATACDQCGYQSVCRIDPWQHEFRVLKAQSTETGEREAV